MKKYIYANLRKIYHYYKTSSLRYCLLILHYYYDFFLYLKSKKIKKNKIIKKIYRDNIKWSFINGKLSYSFRNKDQSIAIFQKYNFLSDVFNQLKNLRNKNKILLKDIFQKKLVKDNFANNLFFKENIFKLKENYPILSKQIYLFYIKNYFTQKNYRINNKEKFFLNFFEKLFIVESPNINIDSKYRKIIVKKFNSFIIKNFESLKIINYFELCSYANTGIYDLEDFNNKKIQLRKNDKRRIFGSTFYDFGNTLAFLFQKIKKFDKNIKIIISPKIICNGFLGAIMQTIYRKQFISNHKLYEETHFSEQYTTEDSTENPYDNYNSAKIAFDEFKKEGRIKSMLSKNMIQRTLSEINKHEYKHPRPYVCIYMQDGSFKKQTKEISLWDTFADINNYEKLINTVIKNGYDVIRMGDPNQKRYNFRNKSFFEYSHSKIKNDINDICITLNCKFFINIGCGGGFRLPFFLGKYSINLEFPFYRRQLFDDKAFYLIKPLINKKNKIVNYEKYFSNSLKTLNNYNRILEKGLKIKDNTEEIIIKGFNEFLFFFKNKKNNLIIPAHKKDDYPYNILCMNETAPPQHTILKYKK